MPCYSSVHVCPTMLECVFLRGHIALIKQLRRKFHDCESQKKKADNTVFLSFIIGVSFKTSHIYLVLDLTGTFTLFEIRLRGKFGERLMPVVTHILRHDVFRYPDLNRN